jgi:Mrp family chromosome partitioning ATPase
MNLGLAFREAGQRVVIADTDFQRPTLHRSIKVEQPGGFVDALDAKRNVEESLTPVGDGMWLVPRGSAMQPRTRSALTTDRVKEVIGRLAERAELVLCDSSPILLVPESLFLAAAVDGVILVAKAGSTGCRELVRAKVMLEGSGAKVIGVVINEMPFYAVKHYYKQYYNAYIRSDAK